MHEIRKAKNGLTMIASRMPHMASVSIGVWVAAGGRYETKEESGISHFLEHMLFKGTQIRSAKDLKRSVEGIGGSFNGFTADEATCYLVKLPGKFLGLGLDILSDMVLNAKLDEREIEKEKQVISEEIKMYRDNPSDHVMEMLGTVMWPDNALGRALTGTLGTLKGMNRQKLLDYKDRMYCPANMVIVASGVLDKGRFFSRAEEAFGHRSAGKASKFETVEVGQKAPRVSMSRRKIKQAHVAFGFPVRRLRERERLAAKLMNIILGGNMSSRLFEELREKYALCYDISSSFKSNKDVAHLHVYAGVDSRNLHKAVVAVVDELRKLKDLGVTDEELERAKRFAKGNFALAMEATSSRMLWLGDRYMTDGEIPVPESVMAAVDRIIAGDIVDVLEEIVDHRKCSLAVVGPVPPSGREKLKREVERI